LLYLYGFMRAQDAPHELPDGVGEPSGTVTALTEGELSALVTEVGDDGIAPRRANLTAHADVLRRAHEVGTVLPLRFGMVMADEDAVRAEIASRADELKRLLAGLEGRLEMSLSALYREEVVLREVVKEHPEVAQAQRGMRGKPAAATHFERIRLGEIVAGAVDAKRAADSAAILHELEPHAVALVAADPLHERMVVNAAFLVDRERLDEFDAAVEQASRRRAERMQFKLLGPLPPHSFVGQG
jgi:Gas vesicle synthesis protein GvpL/GvpF